jgi:hypothetical protein
MARSSIALFLASTTLIAGLAGCGGEAGDEKREGSPAGARPELSAPEGGEGGEGEEKEPQQKPGSEGEGGEGGEG